MPSARRASGWIGRRCGLQPSSVLLAGLDPLLRAGGDLHHAAAFVAGLDAVAVVPWPVPSRRRHLQIHAHCRPFGEVQVGRDDHAGVLAQLAQQVAQQRGTRRQSPDITRVDVARLIASLARRNTLGSNVYARHAPSAKESPMRGVPRRLRRFASVHDVAFGVGSLHRSAASNRKAAEAARDGNCRNDTVCPFIGICCALSLHREEQAQPQAKTHIGGSGPTLQRVHCNHVLRRPLLPHSCPARWTGQRTAR